MIGYRFPRFASADVEIDQAIAWRGRPGCQKCGCVHDDRITPSRKDSCYQDFRPLWCQYPYMADHEILGRLLDRLVAAENRGSDQHEGHRKMEER